jgi:hypothetical protein
MLKRFFKTILRSHYVIVGIILFIILLVIGFWLDFPLAEAALGSAVLAIVGMVVLWWKEEVW